MLDKKLKEALELLGGRAVVKDGDQYYIMLSLREFKKIRQEGLEGLTKQELVDKINNDIASWKFIQEERRTDMLNLDEIGGVSEEQISYEKA
jgi:hypothetical protein